jgi:hypothetical protein
MCSLPEVLPSAVDIFSITQVGERVQKTRSKQQERTALPPTTTVVVIWKEEEENHSGQKGIVPK